ncbi:MAG: glycosyltransferase family 2 protein, partial [Bacteroidaceae bacterium]
MTVEFLEIIHLLEFIFWIYFTCCIVYLVVFAVAAVFYKQSASKRAHKQARIAVVYPAYAEDKVIVDAVKSSLNQNYPKELYDVIVISDHMEDVTNQSLGELPIILLRPIFEESSKAKALQYTIAQIDQDYDALIILDADNRVESDFLTRMNESYQDGHLAIQAHRTAKHLNTPIALLDAASEEMNNAIFRAGHVALGLPSALIGSGMLFDFKWFVSHVGLLETAGEDKEFEIFLVREKVNIEYLKNVPVYDEKTPKAAVLKNQRKRWIAAQLFSFKSHIAQLPNAILTGNI